MINQASFAHWPFKFSPPCFSRPSLRPDALDQNQPDDEPDKLSNRLFQLDPDKEQWTERASMRFSRYRCGTAVLNGEIYVLGGSGRRTPFLTVCLIRTRTPELSPCCSGGIGCEGEDRGQSRRCLSSVEIYNPDTDCWRPGPPQPSALLSLRSHASNLAALGGRLYLCGYLKEAGETVSGACQGLLL